MRLAFLGTAGFAVPALHALLQSDHQLVAVVTGPDKPAGRGRKLTPTPVKQAALDAGFGGEILAPPSPRDPEFIQRFQVLELDAAVVVAYRILPPDVFDSPKLGTLNIHPSLLPRYRGPAPLNWALINGDRETGVSIIRISERVDAGGVVLQERVALDPDETAGQLSDRLAPLGAQLVLTTLEALQAGTLQPIPQDEAQVTKAPKLSKEDGRIDWTRPADEVHNRVRGVTPWPGAYTCLPDGQMLKLFHSKELLDFASEPGEVLRNDFSSDFLVVGCGENAVGFAEVQLQGKKRMPVSEFLKGHPLEPGMQLGAL